MTERKSDARRIAEAVAPVEWSSDECRRECIARITPVIARVLRRLAAERRTAARKGSRA